MGLKKKLAGSVLSASLGLSLVGGGTWAAFNDIEEATGTFGAGTLDLDINDQDGVETALVLRNLKPGDSLEHEFVLHNNGTLAIKDVLMTIDVPEEGFMNGDNEYERHTGESADNTAGEFLEQFQVEILRVDEATGDNFRIIEPEDGITLEDIRNGNLDGVVTVDDKLNLAPMHPGAEDYSGLPVLPEETETIKFKLTFVDDQTTVGDSNYMEQNKFQGDEVTINMSLEARQWNGLDITEETDVDPDTGEVIDNKRSYNGLTPEEYEAAADSE
ncbi:hypothetical protein G4V62_05855 [Bacillaceae bacterium SIJ1]|uniref:TasA family protein n=1 Tax=Litoribacterium kuwaitense TaxID=1398745 RepID=UPI0013EC623C|nr:TasA family protein [Litoribacterium kuwaitense]NGP44505.1 hypothetical protein [Litoribacterium kuwaitense]